MQPKSQVYCACEWSESNKQACDEVALRSPFEVVIEPGASRLCPGITCPGFTTSDELALSLVRASDSWTAYICSYTMPNCGHLLSMVVGSVEQQSAFVEPVARQRKAAPKNLALQDPIALSSGSIWRPGAGIGLVADAPGDGEVGPAAAGEADPDEAQQGIDADAEDTFAEQDLGHVLEVMREAGEDFGASGDEPGQVEDDEDIVAEGGEAEGNGSRPKSPAPPFRVVSPPRT